MKRFHVFKKAYPTKIKIATVFAQTHGEAVQNVSTLRDLNPDDFFAEEVQERIANVCPGLPAGERVAARDGGLRLEDMPALPCGWKSKVGKRWLHDGAGKFVPDTANVLCSSCKAIKNAEGKLKDAIKFWNRGQKRRAAQINKMNGM